MTSSFNFASAHAKASACFIAAALAALLTAPASAQTQAQSPDDPPTQPVKMPANWYSCKQTGTSDCEAIGSKVVELDTRDSIPFPKLVELTFAPAKGSRAELIDTLGLTPRFDKMLPTGTRQYAWQQMTPQGAVEAGITILTYDDHIISISLVRFNRYNLQWSARHPSPPLAKLEETPERRGQVNLKRIRPPGPASADAVRIGFAGSLSPTQTAFISLDLERGVRMAVEEINARSGVQVGDRRLPLEMLVADDKRDPAEAQRVAEALSTAGAIAVIGHAHSVTAIPAAKIYAKNNLAVINVAVTNPTLYAAEAKQGFRMIANDDRVAEVLFHHVSQVLKARSVAIVYEHGIYGERYARNFSAQIANTRISTVSYDAVPPKPATLTALVNSIAEKRPDVVFYAGQEIAGGKLLAELDQAGLNIPVVAIEGACTPQIAPLAGNGVRLLTCGMPGVPMDFLPLGWRFGGLIKRRFDVMGTAYSAYAYDAVQVIVEAVERAGSLDKAVIADALRATDYDGYTGQIAFDGAGELVRGAVSIYNLENGELKWIRAVR